MAHKLPPRPLEMPLDKTVGLDRLVDMVWNSIKEEKVGAIGLYGMGGVGKTTLLKRINNELGKNMLDFDVVIWVVISKDPNLDAIMDNIRKLIGIGDDIWNHYSNREEKVAKIYQVLKWKKFVLLLDDIWQTLDLNDVGVPNPKDIDYRSKVLFTTRFEDVCTRMQAQRTFKVEILTKNEALELFCMKVGEETLNAHPDIPKLAEEMATKCKGLSLALTVVGKAMAGVKNVEVWKYSRNYLMSSPQTALDFEMKVFSILKFSYDRLPDETHKNCFLYCALYPEDHEIQVFDLIEKWMAEGFLDKDARKSIHDIRGHGESVIEKLKQSSLLESVEDDLFMRRTVRLHGVIRDLALWLARDQNKNKKRILVERDSLAVSQNDVETWEVVKRISIIQHGELCSPTVPCPNLISLTLSIGRFIPHVPDIRYMSQLKVLDLSFGFEALIQLPPEIGGLFLLEYLTLKGGMYALDFPTELKNLKKLKFFTLIVNYGDLIFIPLGVISSLRLLRVLAFIGAPSILDEKSAEEREFLEELESLPDLEALHIEIGTEDGFKKLLESTKLQSCMHNLRIWQTGHTPINLSFLSRMKNLHEISLWGLIFVEDSSIFNTCYLSMLCRVAIINTCYSTHLTWLKYAPLLQELHICNCDSLEEVIKEGTEDRENEDDIFSSLVVLHLGGLPNLKSIHKKALPFPSLKFVSVAFCINLKKLPFDSNTGMKKLVKIQGPKQWWNGLEWEDPLMKHKFHSVFQEWDRG